MVDDDSIGRVPSSVEGRDIGIEHSLFVSGTVIIDSPIATIDSPTAMSDSPTSSQNSWFFPPHHNSTVYPLFMSLFQTLMTEVTVSHLELLQALH